MLRVFAVLALLLGGLPGPAWAVEYRLQVANLYHDSFAHYFDGPIGTGSGELRLSRMEKALDDGRIDRGALLSDRTFHYGWDAAARSFDAVKVITEVRPIERPRRWDEAVWDGKPGERSVWVIMPKTSNYRDVTHAALRGAGPDAGLRYYVPYKVSINAAPAAVVGYPLSFLRFYEGHDALWRRYLSKALNLSMGIAAVVGVNDNESLADWVYVVVEHPERPTTFKVVLGWDRRRGGDHSNLEGARDP
ncbi:MAG: hypothetical protein ACREK9_06435 [Candidatus Rokuibacteriota bacterium]